MVLAAEVLKVFQSIFTDLNQHGLKFNSSIRRQDANGGHTVIQFVMSQLKDNNLSPAANHVVDPFLAKALLLKSKSNFHDFTKTFKNALISEVTEAILINILSNGQYTIQDILVEKSQQISNWLNQTDEHYKVVLRIFTALAKTGINEWDYKELNIFERSLMAHRSGVSAEEFLSRLFHCSTYTADFNKNLSKPELIQLAESFSLSLSFSIWRPIHIDDLALQDATWLNSPFLPINFMKMWGAYKYTTRDASSVDFFSRSANFPNPTQVDPTIVKKYQDLFIEVPELFFPMRKIMKGLWEVYSSSNEPDFVGISQSLDGLHDIFIGMDGIIGEAPSGVGHRKYFIKMWIGILNSLNYTKHPNANSNKKIINGMYDLRCELAHGTNRTIEELVKKLKISLGDSFNPGSYDYKSLGYVLSEFLKNIFSEIINLNNFPQLISNQSKTLENGKRIDRIITWLKKLKSKS